MKKNWLLIILFWGTIISIGYLLKEKDRSKLKACSKKNIAVLERKYKAGKKKRVELSMMVNGEKIKHHHSLSNFLSELNIGDSINVNYACTDPTIVEILDKPSY